MVTNRDAVRMQCRGQGLRGRLATVAAAVDLVDLRSGTLVLSGEAVCNQLRLEQHALGEIERIRAALLHHRYLDSSDQARHAVVLAELVHRRPVAGAETGEHGEDRLVVQVFLELRAPGLR